MELVENDTEKIVTGAWPRLNNKGVLINSPFYNEGFKTIRYDSIRRPIDTITNYLLRGNYIYHLQDNGLLENGHPYQIDNDTIVVITKDTILLDLGRNAFLPKLNNEFYVLNINNSIIMGYLDISGDEINQWWQVVIFEKKDNQLINIWDLTSILEQQPSMFYNHEFNYYFDCEWTTEDMMRLLNKEHFKKALRIIRK